ncbi:GNAT family N-acetyltransferase [Sphingomonas sp.]|uniref:GNAT family N-acetyltransferase n=1 Tax=Sphingomonas sp. TaxID=28214 RepID=UPI003B3BB11C
MTAALTTRSGIEIRIRPVTSDDRSQLVDFFRDVSREDLRFRFLTSLREVDPVRIDTLCKAEPPALITFLAFSGEQLAAIATLAGEPDLTKAEVALATRTGWKSRGISWTLLEHVVGYARAQGYRELLSVEKTENGAAIQLERDMGFSISLADDDAGEVIASRPIVGARSAGPAEPATRSDR